ncbi:Lmp protein [Metamycoplasma hominis]|uniref:Lmp protein n=1 Tax=Metamycoplasma hominis TaxID=2098 RepID=UPI001588F879|nr:Lmp protein [Metamycoplasma hominis]QKX31437.1 Lmp protein [Metamycoplasma hominis]
MKRKILLFTPLIIAGSLIPTTLTACNNEDSKLTKQLKAKQLKAKQTFNNLKNKLQDLLNSEDAKDIDANKEINTLANTTIDDNSQIQDIESKTKTIEDAIESLTKKINDKKILIKLRQDFNKAKEDLRNLLASKEVADIEKEIELNTLNTTDIAKDSLQQEIQTKIQKIQEAIQSINKKINDKKLLNKEQQNLVEAKKTLENLIATEDAKTVGIDEAKKILDNNKNNKISTIEEIKKAINDLNDITAKLNQKIANKKQELLENFKKSKQDLEEYINKNLKEIRFIEVKEKAQKTIEKFSNINKDNSSIKEITDATKSLNKAKEDALKEEEGIKKLNEVLEYVNKRNELEKLIKSSNTQSNEDAIKKAQKTLDDNKIANTNESSSKDFEEKRKNIEKAIIELKAAIEATKKSKN